MAFGCQSGNISESKNRFPRAGSGTAQKPSYLFRLFFGFFLLFILTPLLYTKQTRRQAFRIPLFYKANDPTGGTPVGSLITGGSNPMNHIHPVLRLTSADTSKSAPSPPNPLGRLDNPYTPSRSCHLNKHDVFVYRLNNSFLSLKWPPPYSLAD